MISRIVRVRWFCCLPGWQKVYCAGSAAHSQQLTVRRHLKGLTVGGTRLPGPIPAHLPNLARHHVVGEEVGVVLRAHQELPAVGREAGTLDGKVLKVDRLDLGVGLAVHLEEWGRSVEPGHQPHCSGKRGQTIGSSEPNPPKKWRGSAKLCTNYLLLILVKKIYILFSVLYKKSTGV